MMKTNPGQPPMNARYEAAALKMIQACPRWAYWSISRRRFYALKRLEKRGAIRWTPGSYPYWKFEIVTPANQPEKEG